MHAQSPRVQVNRWFGFSTDFWQAAEYFSFVMILMSGTGLSLEIRVVVLTLVRLGVIPHAWLAKGRRYFRFANEVFSLSSRRRRGPGRGGALARFSCCEETPLSNSLPSRSSRGEREVNRSR